MASLLRLEHGPRGHRQPLRDPQRACHERGAGLRPEAQGPRLCPAAKLTAEWRQIVACYQGDYYPLTAYNRDERRWLAWQFDRPEEGDGVVEAFRREKADGSSTTLRLVGLDPSARYQVTDLDSLKTSTLSGSELVEHGLVVRVVTKPAAVLRYATSQVIPYGKRGQRSRRLRDGAASCGGPVGRVRGQPDACWGCRAAGRLRTRATRVSPLPQPPSRGGLAELAACRACQTGQGSGASEEQIVRLAESMGLPPAGHPSPDLVRRAYITILRRNWHLLPYEQLLKLVDMSPEQLAFALREDDFLFIKLGNLKPRCSPVTYAEPDRTARERAAHIKQIVLGHFGAELERPTEPRFSFVDRLSRVPPDFQPPPRRSTEGPRFLSSYFGAFGDPLSDGMAESYPEGLLAPGQLGRQWRLAPCRAASARSGRTGLPGIRRRLAAAAGSPSRWWRKPIDTASMCTSI